MEKATNIKLFSTKVDVHISYINYGDHLGSESNPEEHAYADSDFSVR